MTVFALECQKPVPSTSKLISLHPFIDDDGLFRSNSRLSKIDYLPYNTRHPILLPRKSWITELIVRSYHSQNAHSKDTNHTLASISEKYWILQAREEIRETENKCNRCKRKKFKPAIKIMAPMAYYSRPCGTVTRY